MSVTMRKGPKLNTDLRTRAMLNRPAVYKKTLSTAQLLNPTKIITQASKI